ncbi:VOC family protein [Kribbella sp. NPDC050124]|uniref:VOC family protein n=1 Tax=Kribbella sp. NPDC050124 TaxID=3364114 RepID=UPI00378C0DC4
MSTSTENKIVVGVWPTLVYHDGHAALKFLTEGLGFTQVCLYAGDAEGSIAHSELAWPTGGGVMVSSVGRSHVPDDFSWLADHPQSVYLVVDGDPDPLLAKAIAAGAVVVRGLRDEDYGSRGFTVKDHEGNLWSVGTYPGELTE